MLQCVTVCYSVLQCVAVCCGVLQCVAVCCMYCCRCEEHRVIRVLQVAVCCSVCCSVLQCGAMWCNGRDDVRESLLGHGELYMDLSCPEEVQKIHVILGLYAVTIQVIHNATHRNSI